MLVVSKTGSVGRGGMLPSAVTVMVRVSTSPVLELGLVDLTADRRTLGVGNRRQDRQADQNDGGRNARSPG